MIETGTDIWKTLIKIVKEYMIMQYIPFALLHIDYGPWDVRASFVSLNNGKISV